MIVDAVEGAVWRLAMLTAEEDVVVEGPMGGVVIVVASASSS